MKDTIDRLVFGAALTVLVAGQGTLANVEVTKTHALTLDDAAKYEEGFEHLDYVNPDAPKRGEVRLMAIGGFNSFNNYIIKGDRAAGLGLMDDALMGTSSDDSLSEYGLIAESVEVAEDLSFVIHNLREEARFSDGSPITADDVVFSFHTLVEKGRPLYRLYYADVANVEALNPHRVKFTFSGPPNRELPQIVGQLPVISKAYWEERDFAATTLEPPVVSGPYKIADFEPGRFVVYELVEDYWGANVPIHKGRFNFERLRYDFVRDETVALEAFKAGEYDYRVERTSKVWATSYDFPAVREGKVVVKELPHQRSVGMSCLVLNNRLEKFRNPAVREAISYALDFEWSNENLFYMQYHRTRSFYENSELAATGLPSAEELEILERFRGKIPDQVFTTEYNPPSTAGDSSLRKNLQTAVGLLRESGWQLEDGKLINPADGQQLSMEILLVSPGFERIMLPFVQNLARLGIEGSVRTVDPAQFQNRRRDFDFDSIVATIPQSRSPGNEQREFWSSAAADQQGSRNYAGIKDPVIDELVDLIIKAKSRAELIVATRALDRVLQWGHYVVPFWHSRNDRVAWWTKLQNSGRKPLYGIGFDAWWVDDASLNLIIADEPAN